jgi:hypothetical protein
MRSYATPVLLAVCLSAAGFAAIWWLFSAIQWLVYTVATPFVMQLPVSRHGVWVPFLPFIGLVPIFAIAIRRVQLKKAITRQESSAQVLT